MLSSMVRMLDTLSPPREHGSLNLKESVLTLLHTQGHWRQLPAISNYFALVNFKAIARVLELVIPLSGRASRM